MSFFIPLNHSERESFIVSNILLLTTLKIVASFLLNTLASASKKKAQNRKDNIVYEALLKRLCRVNIRSSDFHLPLI